jgi:hypothetical protein
METKENKTLHCHHVRRNEQILSIATIIHLYKQTSAAESLHIKLNRNTESLD